MSVPVVDRVLIGGEWVRAAGGTYPVIDPATEEPAGHAPECTVEQVRAAARAARAAFERGPWRTMRGAERAACLAEAAERFRREAPGLVELTIAETGAVRPVAETQQVGSSPPPPPTSPCPPAATRTAWSPASRSVWSPASRPSISR